MSDNLIKLVDDLIDFGYGDTLRLDAILHALKQGRQLYNSDQMYVDQLISKYLFPRHEDAALKLREAIKHLNLRPERVVSGEKFRGSTRYKSEGTALVLSMFFGLFGFMGFGHRYVGNIAKSVSVLYTGWVLLILNAFNLYPLILSVVFHQETNYSFPFLLRQISQINLQFDPVVSIAITFMAMIGPPVGYFAFYIWQIFNARNLTREFNKFMDKTGNQLYETTLERKAIFAVISSAPFIIGAAYYIGYALSLRHLIGT